MRKQIWTWLVPPAVNAAVFLVLGLAAIRGIGKNITTGTASSRGWTRTIDDNPIGFCLIVSMKGAMVGFAIADPVRPRADQRSRRTDQARAAVPALNETLTSPLPCG
jgi:hypothetical protein